MSQRRGWLKGGSAQNQWEKSEMEMLFEAPVHFQLENVSSASTCTIVVSI